jgi:hypothetical protein
MCKIKKSIFIGLIIVMSFSFNVEARTFPIRSVNFTSWWFGGFNNEYVDVALQTVKNIGANTVIMDWGVPFDKSSGARLEKFYESATVRTTSLEDVAMVMDKVRALGMDVVLKPHTARAEAGDNINTWNTDVSQMDTNRFFQDWHAYLMQCADLAQQKGSPFIVIGTELNSLTGPEYLGHWVNIINSIRARYSGQITYDALVNAVWDKEFRGVRDASFLGYLDFISLSVYPNLSQNKDASYEELVQGWYVNTEHWRKENTNWVQYITDLHNSTGKEIFFAETGCGSWDGAATVAYQTREGPQDLNEQAMYFQSIFHVWSDVSWLKGVSMWGMNSLDLSPLEQSKYYYYNGHNFYGKPAQNVVQHFYKVVPVYEFVTRFYQQCMSREPDSPGLNGWADALLNGQLSGSDLAFSFVFSTEFINRGTTNEEFLYVLYRAFFGREPDAPGFNGWRNAMNNGIDRATILEGFVGAQEFLNLCSNYGIRPN